MEYNFEKLEVYQLGMDLVKEIYDLIKKYPKDEKFALTNQIKKAVISIPLNIAEGSIMKTKKEFRRYIRIALGSLVEVITNLKIAIQQGYITKKDFDEVVLIEKLFFKLIKLEKYLAR